ncbi:zinc finger protein 511 [Notolabrus celidotus]|uniref:zinc finger protein 511 n=1 Tax=Notolabrus celidotus TaxID=1203425 RepID=UPI00149042D3|nr:zinc finger protein 511 [Notolabrus celidotus]XP_034537239.1 zinc finger protein 511 [Notolabrus celidotus]XP_034537240.1 zinc finger protein 511 [Notolabrus celidotus]
MMQPEFIQLLSEGRVSAKSCDVECASVDPQEPRPDQVEEGNPFNFTPQLIRLHKDHELFEDGDIQRHMYLQDLYISEADEKPTLSVSEFACHISGCSAVFSTLEEYEHHYNSLHRHMCSSCRRSLPSARLLDIHIQEWHDSLFTILAQRQDMYQCLVEGCGQKFRTSQHRKDHLIKIHKYPPDFRFDKPKKDRGEKKRQQQKDTAMEVANSVCESEGVCEVMCDTPSVQPEHGESMETHVFEEEAACAAESASTEEHTDPAAAASRSTENTTSETLKPQYSYRVPANICFGHGSVRGFRGRRGRRK